METKIIDGKKIRGEILEEVKSEIETLAFQPVFTDVLVGSDPASKQYVEMKAKIAEKVGIKFHRAEFADDISVEDLKNEIEGLKHIQDICGVIIQLPLPSSLLEYKQEVLDSVPEELDVDCLGTFASEKFYKGENEIGLPAALACMNILDSVETDLSNKKIVVLGQGDLVGKPVTALLSLRGLHSTTVRSATKNKEAIIKEADVIISGVGKGKFITGDMIKKGVILIDAGTSESNGGIVGDVDLEGVMGIAGYVSPVPGGVGPVTVAMLLKNVLKVAKKI